MSEHRTDLHPSLYRHYYMPPGNMVVELMTDGFTDTAIIEYLVKQSRQVATLPYVARKESTGFIFNRLWAAVKRETLTILAEGVSTPEEIDSMWSEMFVKGASLPCKTMDGKYLLVIDLWHVLIRRQLLALILWHSLKATMSTLR